MSNTAWQVDDKAWMKQRRENWKHIKKKLDKLKRRTFLDFRKDFVRFLKSFYLTGVVDAEECRDFSWGEELNLACPLDHPDLGGLLIECWLSADQSDENWQRIKANYDALDSRHWHNSKKQFFEIMKSVIKTPGWWIPEGESFFGEIEERLSHFFFADWSIDNKSEANAVSSQMIHYLNCPYPDLYYPVLDWLDQWRQAMMQWPELMPEGVIMAVHIVLRSPDNWPDRYVMFSREVLEILRDPELPQEAKDKVESIFNVPLPLEEATIPGSAATYYAVFEDEKNTEQAYRYLNARGVESKGLDLGECAAYGFLSPYRAVNFVHKCGTHSLLFQFDMGVRGTYEMGYLVDPFDDGKTSLYAFFAANSEHDGYYRVTDEKDGREEGPYRVPVKIEPLYKLGEDAKLDTQIASFKDPGEALPLVVETKKQLLI